MSLDQVSSIVTIVAIITAGVWTMFRFGISREHFPKLQFELNLQPLGEWQNKRVVELIATISNKGITRQTIRDFTFNLMVLRENTLFDISDETIENQLKFEVQAKGLNWVQSKSIPFVDGGTIHQFNHVTAVDADVRLVMIYAKFNYQGRSKIFRRSDTYHVSKTFKVS